MKTFDLKSTRISTLNSIEEEELKKYLMTCKFSDRVKFALHILDTEYNLSIHNDIQKRCDNFLNDKIFNNRMLKNVIKKILENEYIDDLSEKEWLEIDNIYIRKTRRKKLKKLNNENI